MKYMFYYKNDMKKMFYYKNDMKYKMIILIKMI